MRYTIGPQRLDRDSFWDDRMMPVLDHPKATEQEPVFTGIFTAAGARIYRSPDEVGYLPRRTDIAKDGSKRQ